MVHALNGQSAVVLNTFQILLDGSDFRLDKDVLRKITEHHDSANDKEWSDKGPSTPYWID